MLSTLHLLVVMPLLFVIDASTSTATENRVLIDAQTISLLVGLVIPLLVGLLTKVNASDGLKAVVNAFLSAVAGALAAFSQTGLDDLNVKTVLISILSTWVVSVATYYGVWKPTGVAGTVADKTRSFGIGSPPVLETPDKGVEDLGQRG